MRKSPEALAEYATKEAHGLCLYLEKATHGVYNSVQYIEPEEGPMGEPPNLILHRSEPAAWVDGVLFTLFALDDGDIAYEPRLQVVQEALLKRVEVNRIERLPAPDSMVKDMLLVEIFLPERRKATSSAEIDGGNT